MKKKTLNSWDEFPKAIAKLRDKYRDCIILFRGQADSKWKLETTLERTPGKVVTVEEYYRRSWRFLNEIESVTRRRWNSANWHEVERHLCKQLSPIECIRPELPCYEYLIYLRHHGFPSPLLDWTASPYVAAYFAFEQLVLADQCVVFAFIERPTGMKNTRADGRVIVPLGRYVTAHQRHVSQKADYTVAMKMTVGSSLGQQEFCSHKDICSAPVNNQVQDSLVRITIPRSDRQRALRQLDNDYNINHYTLFNSEDGLIRTMALRAFELNL